MFKTPVISIVDDDNSVRLAIGSLLRSMGFRAQSFASAQEFLQSQFLEQTSCLISDVQMPSMSGIELQSVLIAQGRQVPTIFITAFPDEAVRAAAMNAGAICFLNKPFESRELIKCLNRAISIR